MTDRVKARAAAVRAAMADIKDIAEKEGATRDALARIRDRLITLAERRERFSAEDFPPAAEGDERNSCLYRLSEEDDHSFALYLNVAGAGAASPVHDHTTWAVIVGMEGDELNRFYEKTADGVRETGSHIVRAGTGVTLLADDLHSIHIDAPEGAVNFHLYGLGLEQLHGRRYHIPATNDWQVFPAHTDIREARPRREP